MIQLNLAKNQKIYFASDFHLGSPDAQKSLEREKKIVRWLDSIRHDAAHIFLLGDLFDFWFEYRYVIPKGFVRFQGKLAELADSGIPISIFTGNHDLWSFGYFNQEMNIPVYRNPQEIVVNNKKLWIGHGDGLGAGDHTYKILKKVFENKLCQWLFEKVHPSLGMGFAEAWSKQSKAKNLKTDGSNYFLGEKEWLWGYCKDIEKQNPHDFYVFGHRHLPLDLPVGKNGRYFNIGEWLSYFTFGEFDGDTFSLKTFKNEHIEDFIFPKA